MRAWSDRAPEVAHLLNPAFCAEVCRRATHAYTAQSGAPLPVPLAYLILPMLLHRETRAEFSHRTRQKMHSWIQEHPELRVGFADRVRRFAPYTLEALSFLVCTGSATLSKGGLSLSSFRPKPMTGRDDVVSEIYRKSGTVGRWLADSGTPEAAYTTWGVRP